MSENPMNETPEPSPDLPLDAGIARRRLLRAGLSAAPVLLALKSQSVLAADICIKPSAFSSLKAAANMTLSRAPNQGWNCKSEDHWKTTFHPSPYQALDKSYFLAIPLGAATGSVSAGFVANPGGWYTGKTLIDVLNEGGSANNITLARHVVATFLTAVSLGDDATQVLLTKSQCQQIWDTQGNWSPFAGATWNLQSWLDYFDYIYN